MRLNYGRLLSTTNFFFTCVSFILLHTSYPPCMAFLANASKLIAEKTSGSTTYLHMSNSGVRRSSIATHPCLTILQNKHHKRTFVNEHGVFTSPNADTLPHFPLPGMLEDLPDPKHAQNTMWANNRWIALGFVPLRLRYDRPFDVLRPRYDGSFPIEQLANKRWRIKPHLSRSWHQLQANLLTLCWHVSSQSKNSCTRRQRTISPAR